MKRLTLLLTLIIFSGIVWSQPCFPEGKAITSQAQVDSFQDDYPNCTEIEGDLLIHSNQLSNLYGLSSIEAVHKNFVVRYTYHLENLEGLENLKYIGGSLIFGDYNNEWGHVRISSLSGLENLEYVGSDVIINNIEKMTTLEGLEKIDTIYGDLIVENSTTLQSLKGLDSVRSVGRDITIHNNTKLTDIESLQGLSKINRNLYIETNPNLLTLDGLNNIKSIEGGFNLILNFSLHSISALSNLTTIGEGLFFYGNRNLFSIDGLDNLNSIGQSLDITYSQIKSLTPLSGLNSIGKSVTLRAIESAPDIKFLKNFTSVNGTLLIRHMGSLQNLSGLENITNVKGDLILYVLPLKSLAELHKLDSVGGYFDITGVDSIKSLHGLENLKSVNGYLKIFSNDSLVDLSGLNNLKSINGELHIDFNTNLRSLSGIDSIDPNSITRLYLSSNHSLTECSIKSICEYIGIPDAIIDIGSNSTGCDSKEEIIANCIYEDINDHMGQINSVYPNPFTTSTTIEYTLNSPQTITINFYDTYGRLVDKITEHQQQGLQKVVWKPQGLTERIYIVRMEMNDRVITRKLMSF